MALISALLCVPRPLSQDFLLATCRILELLCAAILKLLSNSERDVINYSAPIFLVSLHFFPSDLLIHFVPIIPSSIPKFGFIGMETGN